MRTWGDPNEKLHAQQNMTNLKCRTGITDYNCEFLKLAPKTKYNEEALINHYENGLPLQLQRALLSYERPDSLQEIIELAVALDSRRASHQKPVEQKESLHPVGMWGRQKLAARLSSEQR